MDILGIGIPELTFIIIIALIVLGPKDMQKAGKTIGSWLNKVVKSDEWRSIANASRKLKTLPNELMHEANIDELRNDLSGFNQYRNEKIKVTLPKNDYGAWGGKTVPPPTTENSIAPPVETTPAPAKKTKAEPKTEPDKPASESTENA